MFLKGFLLAAALALALPSFAEMAAADFYKHLKGQRRFATWQGIEPDKWATVWLIKRYISPDAYFLLFAPNTELPTDATHFGVPQALIKRANRKSMFHGVKAMAALNAPELAYIDAIIHDVEVNIWDAPAHPHSPWFETVFRQLQARYQRDQVPSDCYLAIFDALASASTITDISASRFVEALDIRAQCPGLPSPTASFVTSLSQLEILREISLGKKIVFIDTREAEEYEEVHLPGAEIVRLRDVTAERLKDFADVDLLVPYCVKDFRGFEVAKAIKTLGFSRVATLSPNGLKGWLNSQLPVVNASTSEAEAHEALLRCAMEPHQCIKEDHR